MAYKIIKIGILAEGVNEERLDKLEKALIEIFSEDLLGMGTNNKVYNKQE